MNVASLELCKELYELSGWVPEGPNEGYYPRGSNLVYGHKLLINDGDIPAYNLGYLLRKLPYPEIRLGITGRWQAHYGYKTDRFTLTFPGAVAGFGNTPEDAVAKLAIELFKAKILVRGDK